MKEGSVQGKLGGGVCDRKIGKDIKEPKNTRKKKQGGVRKEQRSNWIGGILVAEF